MIAVIGAVFATNLVVMVVTTINMLRRKFRLKAMRKKNIKRRIEMMRIRKLSKFDVDIINEEPVNLASYDNIPVVSKQEGDPMGSTEDEKIRIHPNGPQEDKESGLLVSDDSGYDYEQR